MFSTVGKATVNLFPQFQASGKAEIHKDPHAIVETTKTSKKEKGKDEFFFYNILDYNKEAAARLRDTSYVPRSEAPPVGKYKPKYKTVFPELNSNVRYYPPTQRSQHTDRRDEKEEARRHDLILKCQSKEKRARVSKPHIRTVDFSHMSDRNLIPQSEERSPSSDGEVRNPLSGQEWKEWTKRDEVERKSEHRTTTKKGFLFDKQTERTALFLAIKGQTSGFEYSQQGKAFGSTKGILPFSKALPREQFSSRERLADTKYFSYFPVRRNPSHRTTLLDFKNMTGRDKDPSQRMGYTSLERAPPEIMEPKSYQRRQQFHVMDVKDIIEENLKLVSG